MGHCKRVMPATEKILALCAPQDAMDRGYFKQREELGFQGSRELVPRMTCGPNMGAICSTAYEIACGMAYLHSRNVVHGGEPSLQPRERRGLVTAPRRGPAVLGGPVF
jgi:hypothetical protein